MLSKPAVTRLGLLRHAQTVWNRDKRIQGQEDSPLTPEGEMLARTWGEFLKPLPWHRLLVSDLGRAVATAERLNTALQLPMEQSRRLREQDWGLWTGRRVAELRQTTPQLLADQERAGWEFRPPGGESRLQVWQRCQRALTEAAARWPGQTILVVAHEGVLKCLLYRLDHRRFLPSEIPLFSAGHLHWLIHREHQDGRSLEIDRINALALPSR